MYLHTGGVEVLIQMSGCMVIFFLANIREGLFQINSTSAVFGRLVPVLYQNVYSSHCQRRRLHFELLRS